MPLCPQCSAEVASSDRKCPSCGAEVNLTSDPTAVQTPDHTPTRLKKTKAEERVHTTASGSGARFVAGHVLAGRYRIIGLIGRGGMGEVYKAEDLELDQTVALKFLPAELSKEEDLLKRFRSEVRTARQVSHPNVCRVFDIGETEGLYYITMEFIEGDDLSMLLQRIGRLPSDKAVEISRQICLGLGAIHKAGILHRDLKPSNIIIDQKGEARITDFGIAGIEAEVQGEESRVGTPAYMSPEQITGKEVTKRSDIYSLGLLLYEIFTGKQAFEGSSVQELREKHTKETPTNPSQIVTGIDPVVEDLIERCLAKDPQERPDSALKVAMMLPGGNPLQVALEAGETPTPEMVAAAPKKGTMSRLAGIALLGGFVILTLVWTNVAVQTFKPVLEPLTEPPEVLAARARQIAERFGYSYDSPDSSYRYSRDNKLIEYADSRDDTEKFWTRFRTGQPSPLHFVYRQSPQLLVPSDEDAPITNDDPPMTLPGMIRIELDVEGRLKSFTSVPHLERQSTKGAETDWSAAFEEAGLDLRAFDSVEPRITTIYNHDELKSWTGVLPANPDIPITIEAAAFDGRPIAFQIYAPWNEDPTDSYSNVPTGYFGSIEVFFFFLLTGVLIASCLLARYNLKKGSGDLKGALKVAASVFVLRTLSNYIFTEKIGVLTHDTARISELLESSVFLSAVVFIVYLSIEPIIRRRFPDLLVSWNRILAGAFRDPLVGRDVLVGLFVSSATITVAWLTGELLRLFVPATPTASNLLKATSLAQLQGPSFLLGGIISVLWDAIFACFIFLTLFLLAFLVFRRRWAAAVAFCLLFLTPTFLEGSDLGLAASIVGNTAFFVGLLISLLRFSFVAAVAYMVATPAFHLLTFDPNKFFFPSTLLMLACYFGISFIAFLVATGGQPWMKRDLLE